MNNFGGLETPTITRVFDGYIEDTISDEQIQRVLESVFQLIRDGAFDRPRSFFWIIRQKRARSVALRMTDNKIIH